MESAERRLGSAPYGLLFTYATLRTVHGAGCSLYGTKGPEVTTLAVVLPRVAFIISE